MEGPLPFEKSQIFQTPHRQIRKMQKYSRLLDLENFGQKSTIVKFES